MFRIKMENLKHSIKIEIIMDVKRVHLEEARVATRTIIKL
jgi:hypothetical protein